MAGPFDEFFGTDPTQEDIDNLAEELGMDMTPDENGNIRGVMFPDWVLSFAHALLPLAIAPAVAHGSMRGIIVSIAYAVMIGGKAQEKGWDLTLQPSEEVDVSNEEIEKILHFTDAIRKEMYGEDENR